MYMRRRKSYPFPSHISTVMSCGIESSNHFIQTGTRFCADWLSDKWIGFFLPSLANADRASALGHAAAPQVAHTAPRELSCFSFPKWAPVLFKISKEEYRGEGEGSAVREFQRKTELKRSTFAPYSRLKCA
jgi:hypothetical protein